MADFDQVVADLKRLRDELALKIHLGSKEAQEQWSTLEKKWGRFASEAELHQSVKEISAAARALGDELKDGFESIKKALRSSQ